MTQNVEVSTGPLDGLSGAARFRPVAGKNPGAKGKLWVGEWRDDDGEQWNSEPWKWQTAEQIGLTMNRPGNSYTGIGLMTGADVGGYCWIDFDGEEIGPDGEYVRHASGDFMVVFEKPVFDLPPAPTNISGREGRKRLLFRVPEAWQSVLRGRSISSDGPTGSIEWLYEKGKPHEPKPFHAVVEGTHPKGNGWFYRWEPDKSPRDIPVPDLPEWMIKSILTWPYRKKLLNTQNSNGTVYEEDKPAPTDLLSPGKQKKLLKGMQPFFNYRGAPAGKFAGTYDILRRLTLSLWRGIDDENMFEMWLQDWDDKSDWSDLSGGSMTSFAKSLLKSDAGGDVVKPWATAWAIAVENGWVPPKWAMPPREIDVSSMVGHVTKMRDQFEKGLKEIYSWEDPADRQLGLHDLKEQVGIKNEKVWNAVLFSMEQRGKEPEIKARTWTEVVSNAAKITPAIDKFLPFGAVTMLGADPGTGKTVFLYRVAEAAAYGKKFMGQLGCEKGNVLIIQKDESDSNLAQKDEKMCIEDPEKNIHCRFEFDPMQVRDIEQWITDVDARYVVMDSFGSLFAGGADLVDANAGYYLYELNRIASKKNVAILLTHHLTKLKDRERGDVFLSDFYGSTFIAAGTSDAWGLHMDQQSEGSEKPMILKSLKARTGIAEAGDRYVLDRDSDDLSLTIQKYNGLEDGIGGLKKNEAHVLKKLREAATNESEAVVVGDEATFGTLSNLTGLGKRPLNRALDALKKDPRAGLRTVLMPPSGKGKRARGYWVEK